MPWQQTTNWHRMVVHLHVSMSTAMLLSEPNGVWCSIYGDGAFTCFNVNCYATFRTERGLMQHLWRSVSCGRYTSEPRPVLAASVGILHERTWRRRLGYGIEYLRVNRFMNADPRHTNLTKFSTILKTSMLMMTAVMTRLNWTITLWKA
jgi:hypothetical protein